MLSQPLQWPEFYLIYTYCVQERESEQQEQQQKKNYTEIGEERKKKTAKTYTHNVHQHTKYKLIKKKKDEKELKA